MILTNQVLQDPCKKNCLFSKRDISDLFILKVDNIGDGYYKIEEKTKRNSVADLGKDTTSSYQTSNNDNFDSFYTVLKTKGITGVLDHDFVDNQPSYKKFLLTYKTEEYAKCVAKGVIKFLEDIFTVSNNRSDTNINKVFKRTEYCDFVMNYHNGYNDSSGVSLLDYLCLITRFQ